MTADRCNDYLDYDESWFSCDLPTGHVGRHRDEMGADDNPRGMTVEWDQEPPTVAGEVVP